MSSANLLCEKGQFSQLKLPDHVCPTRFETRVSSGKRCSVVHLPLGVALDVMKLNLGKRSFKDIVVGDYDYKFLCMVRAAIDLPKLNVVQHHNVSRKLDWQITRACINHMQWAFVTHFVFASAFRLTTMHTPIMIVLLLIAFSPSARRSTGMLIALLLCICSLSGRGALRQLIRAPPFFLRTKSFRCL